LSGCRQAFKVGRQLGLDPSLRQWTIAIDACGAKVARALHMMDEMILSHSTSPNAVTYCAVLSVCRRAGRWQDALRLLAEAQDVGIELNPVAVANAIASCGRQGQWPVALCILDAAVEGLDWPSEDRFTGEGAPLGPSGAAEAPVAEIRCCYGGDADRGRGLINVVVLGAAVSVLCRSGEVGAAVALVWRMERGDWGPDAKPNEVVYGTVLRALMDEIYIVPGARAAAEGLMRQMDERGMSFEPGKGAYRFSGNVLMRLRECGLLSCPETEVDSQGDPFEAASMCEYIDE